MNLSKFNCRDQSVDIYCAEKFPFMSASFTKRSSVSMATHLLHHSNSLLLEGDTYLRSACGGSSDGEARMLCVKSVYLSRNFVELCPSTEIPLIHSISEFRLLAIMPAFRDTFILISNSVHRPSERLLRFFRVFVLMPERTRQIVKVFLKLHSAKFFKIFLTYSSLLKIE